MFSGYLQYKFFCLPASVQNIREVESLVDGGDEMSYGFRAVALVFVLYSHLIGLIILPI